MFSWSAVSRPIIALAPMAGYTDSPYRQIVKELCPSVVCFMEFVNVDGVLHGNKSIIRQTSFDKKKECPIVAQIFGKKPESFQKAARALTDLGVDAIDINMGCPAKKIVSSDHGSALLKNCELAEEIVQATVESTPLPISVKMRIGTTKYDPDYFFEFAKRMEAAGAKLITVHGRTSKQMFSGISDWQPIYELKKKLKIPIIGNGDIKTGADATAKIGNLDGIMVGRGAIGNPWIFPEIVASIEGKTYKYPTFEEKLPMIIKHVELSCLLKGEKYGILEMRKHLAWYIRGIPNASGFRQRLVTVSSRSETISILKSFPSNP